MRAPATPRFRLRDATAADHQRVDDAFAAFDLGDRASYARFLIAQAEAFVPVEAAIDRSAIGEVLPDWPERRRSALLQADLAALGADASPGNAPDFDSIEAALGAVYVLEGSRLGGRMLARGVGTGLPRRFIAADDAKRWPRLIDIMDRTLLTEHQFALAVAAARAVFARFEASARRQLECVTA